MEVLPSEIYYRILDFLSPKSIQQLDQVSRTLLQKNQEYQIKMVFVNYRLQKNTIFIFSWKYIASELEMLARIFNSIAMNDFNYPDFQPLFYVNIVTGMNIDAYAVLEYYQKYLKSLEYYIFPYLDLNKTNHTQIITLDSTRRNTEYCVYWENQIKLYQFIKKYITPQKNFKNEIYFNQYENLIDSHLL